MAERRMFAKTIIDSDAFLDMPVTARLLYYDLSMRADDDGFVNAPKKIMRMIGASQDDLSLLVLKSFIIPFESGVVVIKHWRIHNYIRKDTYNGTPYKTEMAMLKLDDNKVYQLDGNEVYTERQRTVDEPSTQDRLGKDRLDKDIKERDKEKEKPGKKIPPTLDEVRDYCLTNQKYIDADAFWNYYNSHGWRVGKNPMKDWHSAIATWERNDKQYGRTNYKPESKPKYRLSDV